MVKGLVILFLLHVCNVFARATNKVISSVFSLYFELTGVKSISYFTYASKDNCLCLFFFLFFFFFPLNQPITSSPPKWMAELENDDIDMLKGEYGHHGQRGCLRVGIQCLLKSWARETFWSLLELKGWGMFLLLCSVFLPGFWPDCPAICAVFTFLSCYWFASILKARGSCE